MYTQEEVLTKCIEFYREFEHELSQYYYDEELYQPMLIRMGYELAEDFDLPPEMLIEFARSVH